MLKKFLFHLAVILIVVFTINVHARIQFAPLSWANIYTNHKSNVLKQNIEVYNTVLFGSSRTSNQIDPIYLDELTNTTLNTTTYNFGSAGVGHMELYYLYSKMLQNEDFKPKYILYEVLPAFEWSRPTNKLVTRNYYWRDLHNFLTSIPIIWKHDDDYKTNTLVSRTSATAQYITLWLKNIANIEVWRTVMGLEKTMIYPNDRGYAPLKINDTIRSKRRIYFQANPDQHDNLIKRLQSYSEYNCGSHSKAMEEFYSHILRMAAEKGIQLYFVHTPPGTYKRIKCIIDILPKNTYIEAPDINEFSYLYDRQYFFDQGHLNSEGAKLYTKYFADQLIKKHQFSL